jgi:hypothetical protein
MIHRTAGSICRQNAGNAYTEKVNKQTIIAPSPKEAVSWKRKKRGGRKMRETKRASKAPTMAMIIWSNIVRQQYLKGLDDEQLSSLLGITTRTLYNYRADPSALTLKQLQSIVEMLNIEMESLLLAG